MSSSSVLFDAPGPAARRRHLIMSIAGALIGLGVLAYVVVILWQRNQITPAKWEPLFGAEAWTDFILPGLRATLISAFFAIIIAFALGIIGALARMSDVKPIRWVAGILIEFFRAVPVLIMMIFAVNFLLRYVDALSADLRPLVAVVLGLVLYNGSVIAEVIRNGVASLPKGQQEAGLSIGLSPSQVRRSILVPQALTAMLPTLVSQLVVVLKDSALGYIILYPELLISARQMANRFGNMFVSLTVVAVLFITINYLITKLAERIESRQRRRQRSSVGMAKDTIAPATTYGPSMDVTSQLGGPGTRPGDEPRHR